MHTNSERKIRSQRYLKNRPVSKPKRRAGFTLARDKGEGQNNPKDYIVTIPKSCQLFADRYLAWGALNTNGDITGAAGVFTHSFQVNNPFNGYGPQVNYTGGFSTNAPSGANYLLGGFSGSSSQIASAPYNRYIVLKHEIEVSILSSGATPNTIPTTLGITYSQNSVGTENQVVTQLPEQPHTRWKNVPCVTTAGPVRVEIDADVADLFGVKRQFYQENHGVYGAPAGASPSRIMYVHVWLRAADGTTTAIYYTWTIRHRFLLLFTDLNSFSTTVPSALSLHESKSNAPQPSRWHIL